MSVQVADVAANLLSLCIQFVLELLWNDSLNHLTTITIWPVHVHLGALAGDKTRRFDRLRRVKRNELGGVSLA